MQNKSSLYSLGFSLLSKKNYFSFELRQKLLKKGYSMEEIEAFLHEMINSKLMNDESYFCQYINDWQSYKKKGRFSLIMKLKEKGAEKDLIDQMLDKYYDMEKEKKNAIQWIKVKSHHSLSIAEEKARIHRFLQYRGFSYDLYRNEMEDN